ncbi:hypothetical protein [Priestia endophytica]|uniref:hypothetical protein n=1 Tax=Priestia endophytica TaxID=135735 RepID=UPI00124E150D|nr:hypothetical protein [Priestia endophytica]KAB2489466.1 hypothetical protein F8155_23620 [Priestia endophytica]
MKMNLDESQRGILLKETGKNFTVIETSEEELDSIAGGSFVYRPPYSATTMALGEEDFLIKLK